MGNINFSRNFYAILYIIYIMIFILTSGNTVVTFLRSGNFVIMLTRILSKDSELEKNRIVLTVNQNIHRKRHTFRTHRNVPTTFTVTRIILRVPMIQCGFISLVQTFYIITATVTTTGIIRKVGPVWDVYY
ncbi:hypothetical protein RhiirA4_28884 [Rhizophagus irregularis]|uniref:Uncharacterized protein n=1 Tax=Rhizophagus irregularis TaxID=588596 RepID=A0A2I1H1G3_9GLOM|nr:hypothetical protein RhiirA4_28884 [Rhizophagus irregularis]